MQYRLREGAHNSIRSRFRSIVRQAKGHNWLPMIAAGITTAWLGIILAAFQVAPPVSSDTPTIQSHSDQDQNLTVSNASAVTNNTPTASDPQPQAPSTEHAKQEVANASTKNTSVPSTTTDRSSSPNVTVAANTPVAHVSASTTTPSPNPAPTPQTPSPATPSGETQTNDGLGVGATITTGIIDVDAGVNVGPGNTGVSLGVDLL